MRRSPFVIAASVAGLYGILSFHTRKPNTNLAIGSTPTTIPANAHAAKTPAGTTGGVSGPPPSPTTTAPSAARTATGSLVQYGYGELSVRVTLHGSRITNVALADIQVADQTSGIIAQQAVPILQQEVLSAQSARIDAVSGATYTSEAYARSLQAALTRAHA